MGCFIFTTFLLEPHLIQISILFFTRSKKKQAIHKFSLRPSFVATLFVDAHFIKDLFVRRDFLYIQKIGREGREVYYHSAFKSR